MGEASKERGKGGDEKGGLVDGPGGTATEDRPDLATECNESTKRHKHK